MAAGASDAGRVRANNEDRWLIRERAGVTLLCVADGVGGLAGGEVASAAAVDGVADRFFTAVPAEGARGALTTAVAHANSAVVDAAHGSATTLVLAAVRKRDLAVASLGDSRAYLVRAAIIRQLTTDHSGAQPGSITRFLGDPGGVQPDVFVETLRAHDRVVLCSDGLTRHVTDAEIAARAADDDPARATARLVALANERGGEDNVTVVVYRVPDRGYAPLVVLIAAVVLGILGAVLVLTTSAPRSIP